MRGDEGLRVTSTAPAEGVQRRPRHVMLLAPKIRIEVQRRQRDCTPKAQASLLELYVLCDKAGLAL